jgi:uncharacterized protein (DUF58 family)
MKKIKQLFLDLYFTPRFFFSMLGVVSCFVVSFAFEFLYPMVWLIFIALISFTLLELFFLVFSKHKITVVRTPPEKLSNGDENDIGLLLRSTFPLRMFVEVIDELPSQFQSRDFSHKAHVNPKGEKAMHYRLRPTYRGVYEFGLVHVFASTWLGLIRRRFSSAEPQTVRCYPSFLALRNIDIRAVANEQMIIGSRKIRRIEAPWSLNKSKNT